MLYIFHQLFPVPTTWGRPLNSSSLFLFIRYGAMDRVNTAIARQIWPGISELSDDNVVPLRRRAVLASPISCFHS